MGRRAVGRCISNLEIGNLPGKSAVIMCSAAAPIFALMKPFSLHRLCLFGSWQMAAGVILLMTAGCSGWSVDQGDPTLVSVVAICRHGIRSPTNTQASMNLYTQRAQGFPDWPEPANTAGYLSTVGKQN